MNQPMSNVYFENFVLVGVCGKGAYGKVYKIKEVTSGKYYALKEVKVSKNNSDPLQEDTSLYGHVNIRRYTVLLICNRPPFLKKKKCTKCLYTYILSDYFEYTLRDFLRLRNELISDPDASKENLPKIVLDSFNFVDGVAVLNLEFLNKIFEGIAFGIRYLHENKRMHRDMKPENIFFKNGVNPVPKIGDFGDIKIYDSEVSECLYSDEKIPMTCDIGTEAYRAPEICTCCYNTNIDVYSLGLIYFELLYPFETEMERLLMFESLRSTGKVPDDFKEKYPEESSIIESCIEKNPCQRFSSRDVVKRLFYFFDQNNGFKKFGSEK